MPVKHPGFWCGFCVETEQKILGREVKLGSGGGTANKVLSL